MNIKSAIYGLISIKPQPVYRVVNRLPYSKESIYNAIEKMRYQGELIKTRINGEYNLDIPKDYAHQKKREFFIKALSYGMDPEILLRKSSKRVWDALDHNKRIDSLSKTTNFSERTVFKILHLFHDYGLIKFLSNRPLIIKKINGHPINIFLKDLIKTNEISEKLYSPGSIPYEEIIATPDEIENILYKKIDNSLTVRKTGFLLRGEGRKIAVIESIPRKLSIEGIFLRKILTPDGVEDSCIRLIASKKINFEKLLRFSLKKNIVNLVGCYLNIINDINPSLVSEEIIENFYRNISNKKIMFLKYDKKYGKMGWERKYENKWNVDLYLDLGAVKHGVRSI